MITINETLYKKMPEDIKICFEQLPNKSNEEVRECFPDLGRSSKLGNNCKSTGGWSTGLKMSEKGKTNDYSDSGNASRFFKSIIYQAKASKAERNRGCEGLEEKVFSDRNPELASADMPQNRSGNAKANHHPTVKPIALMEYLIKMVTPKGGVVLDPFAGSGSTLVAAKQNGYKYIGIELTEEYIPIIEARLEAVKEIKLL
jgi:site-specific DNA-methyltransferase (adenine-specific)